MTRRERLELIELADNARREQRIQSEIDAFIASKEQLDSTVAGELPNHRRDVRYAERYRGWPTRVAGVATGTESTSNGEHTVLVKHKDGTSEIVSHRSLRTKTRTTDNTIQRPKTDIEKWRERHGS